VREKFKRSTYRFGLVILHLWVVKKGMRCCKKTTVYKIYTPTPFTISKSFLSLMEKKNPQEG